MTIQSVTPFGAIEIAYIAEGKIQICERWPASVHEG